MLIKPQPWTWIRNLFTRHRAHPGKSTELVYPKGLLDIFAIAYNDVWSQFYQNEMQVPIDRYQLYREYDIYDSDDIIVQVLNLFCEEACQTDIATGKLVWCEAENKDIADLNNKLLFDIQIDKNAYAIVRELAKYGDSFSGLIQEERDDGTPGAIVDLVAAPVYSVSRVEDNLRRLVGWSLLPIEQMSSSNLWSKLGSVRQEQATDPPWSFVHFRLTGFNRIIPYGSSLLLPARRLYRRLRLCEDNLVLYRLKRAPDRFVFKLKNLAGLSPSEISNVMRKIRQELRKKMDIERTTSYVKSEVEPITIDEDLLINTDVMDIDRLQGSQQINSVLDIDYLRKRFVGCIGIPPDYLGFSESPGSFAADIPLSFQDVNFARKIKRLQAAFMEGIADILKINLCWHGIDPFSEQAKFELKMNFVSATDEKQRLEVEKVRADTLDVLQKIGSKLEVDPVEWEKYLLRRSMIPLSLLSPKGGEEISSIMKGKMNVTEDRAKEIDKLIARHPTEKEQLARCLFEIKELRKRLQVLGGHTFRSEHSSLSREELPIPTKDEDGKALYESSISQMWEEGGEATIKGEEASKSLMDEVTKLLETQKQKEDEIEEAEQERKNNGKRQ